METMTINIINPKAKKLIKDLADMNLIEIDKKSDKVIDYLKKIRSKVKNPPTFEEITEIVEEVRTEMYNKSIKE
jgi:hypothetical protein